jgi:hypothetical protein
MLMRHALEAISVDLMIRNKIEATDKTVSERLGRLEGQIIPEYDKETARVLYTALNLTNEIAHPYLTTDVHSYEELCKFYKERFEPVILRYMGIASKRRIRKYLADIIRVLIQKSTNEDRVYYNINFPDIPVEEIKGVRMAYQGKGRWIREFKEWDVNHYAKYGITPELLGQSSNPVVEEGEDLYMMVGEFVDDPQNTSRADHKVVKDGYISVVAHNIDCTDYKEYGRLEQEIDTDFKL